MSIADDDETMEDNEEATEMQCDMQSISHQVTKSLACSDVASCQVSDVKVQQPGNNSVLQACASSEVGCTYLFEVELYYHFVSINNHPFVF